MPNVAARMAAASLDKKQKLKKTSAPTHIHGGPNKLAPTRVRRQPNDAVCKANMQRCLRLIKRWVYSVHGSKGCVALEVGAGHIPEHTIWEEMGLKQVLAVDNDARATRIGQARAAVTGSRSGLTYEFLAADMNDPVALWHHMLCADIAYCHFAIHRFLERDLGLTHFMRNIKQQLKPGARVVVTFLESAKLKRLTLPFTVVSPDGGKTGLLIEELSLTPDCRIRVRDCAIDSELHEELVVDTTALTTVFSQHGFHTESVVGCDQLCEVMSSAEGAAVSQDEKLLLGLCACATFRLGAPPRVTSYEQPLRTPRHRLFLPAVVFVPFLELIEMLRLTCACRAACELVHRRTRLSARPSSLCARCTLINMPGRRRCRACDADLNPSGSDTLYRYTPRIGNYRLPANKFTIPITTLYKCSFLSFLFKVFGQAVMAERSWYINHIWRDKDATALWLCTCSAEDENVTDKDFEYLLSRAESQSDDDDITPDDYSPPVDWASRGMWSTSTSEESLSE